MFCSFILFLVLLSECVFPQVISLRDTTNQFDYVVITTPDLITSCETFKQHKESFYGIKVLLVDTTMIYSEFDTAYTKAEDIRDFISYAGTFWENPRPKYFLLAGNLEKIPALTYAIIQDSLEPTDYFYSQSIYEQDPWTIEFYIGRVPAINTTELNNYFSKVITYENETVPGNWVNNVMIASEYEPDPFFGFEAEAYHFSTLLPSYMIPDLFIEEDSLHREQYRQQFIDKINQTGYSSVWYIGVGKDSSIGYSNYFCNSDVSALSNLEKLFFVNLRVHHLRMNSDKSLMDELIVSENGAVSGIASVGISFWGISNIFNEWFVERMYSEDSISVGEVMNIDPLPGLYLSQRKLICLWGDPSLNIKFNSTADIELSQKKLNDFQLLQNYPNPFNPTTTIKYTVPQEGNIKLVVYDLLGKEVKTLVNGFTKSGNHQVIFDASSLSSGIYFYKLIFGNSSQIKKMILLK